MAGRPKEKIDWEKVDAMLQFGPSQRYIAEYLKISAKTLERHIKSKFKCTFAEYKDKKMDKTRLALQQKAIQKALNGDNTMLIFCLKNICHWTDNKKLEDVAEEIKIMVTEQQKKVL